jgi:RNA polymerase sigma factor (sigma-70 family)
MASGQLDQFLRRYRQDGSAEATEHQTDAQLLQRFAATQDGAAFEALVRRHGPMVLGLCRRLLHNATDAEDAFQATFLVLVRKAGAIAKPELLGNWLYGVAYRVAVRARANAARRTAHERQAASMPKTEPTPAPDRELRQVLDEEINRLPEKYRAPLILCYLEGKTNEQAARQLGCPVGSMSWRLARGREMLRQRLNRRQLAFSPLMFPPVLAQHTSSAALPSVLVKATVQVAVNVAQGGAAAAGSTAAAANALAEETLKALHVARVVKMAALGGISLLGFFLLLFGAYALVAYFGTDGPPLPSFLCSPRPGG